MLWNCHGHQKETEGCCDPAGIEDDGGALLWGLCVYEVAAGAASVAS